MQKRNVLWAMLALLVALLFTARTATAQEDLTVWPNRVSSANSDEWLVQNHNKIRQMRPRLLVLNFVNGLSEEKARAKVDGLIAALRESSRWHGYADPKAPAFLDYQIAKMV